MNRGKTFLPPDSDFKFLGLCRVFDVAERTALDG